MSIQSKYNYTAKRDDYLTPSVIYERVLEENNLQTFDCDVCSSFPNIPAKMHYRKDGLYSISGRKLTDNNGLTGTWFKFNWCNPPFGICNKFVKKATEEQKKGKTTFMLIPVRTERKFWHQYILFNGRFPKPYVDIEFLPSGTRFIHPETGEEMGLHKGALALITFRGYTDE